MHEFGTTSEQLAEIAVGVREHAALNPDAMYRDPLTVDDVLSSRMIADPLHKLDCCVVSDGGGARHHDDRGAGPGPATSRRSTCSARRRHRRTGTSSQMPDFTRTAAAAARGRRRSREAGVTAGRHRHDPALRQLHDHRAAAARGPRLLREGRGRARSSTGAPAPRRRAADEHRRRRALAVPPGHARHLPADRGGAPAARRGRRGAGARRRAALACGSGGWLSCMGAVVLGKDRG